MMSSLVPLVPSNLARPPIFWSALEVKAWLKFCMEEFDLKFVNAEKFNMNGKALLLLTRMDFMERSPHAGDILFNAFQHLRSQDKIGNGGLQTVSTGSVFVPILPQPPLTSKYIVTDKAQSVTSHSILPSACEAGMISPALPGEASPQGAESSHCDKRPCPHTGDQEMDCDEIKDNGSGCPNDDGGCRLLWMFIYQLLSNTKCSHIVCWESIDDLTFRISNTESLADQWGKQKNRSNMTYEKLSRALRYYYKMNIIKKVAGRKLTYQFLQHPSKIQKGQRGAKPRSSKLLTESVKECEKVTPDSSTCPNAQSTPSPHSSGGQSFNSPISSTDSSPGVHHIFVKSLENSTSGSSGSQDISHLQIVSSSANSAVSTCQHEPILGPDLETSSTVKISNRSHCVSPDHNFVLKKSQSPNNLIYEVKYNSRSQSSDCNNNYYLSYSQNGNPTINQYLHRNQNINQQSHGNQTIKKYSHENQSSNQLPCGNQTVIKYLQGNQSINQHSHINQNVSKQSHDNQTINQQSHNNPNIKKQSQEHKTELFQCGMTNKYNHIDHSHFSIRAVDDLNVYQHKSNDYFTQEEDYLHHSIFSPVHRQPSEPLNSRSVTALLSTDTEKESDNQPYIILPHDQNALLSHDFISQSHYRTILNHRKQYEHQHSHQHSPDFANYDEVHNNFNEQYYTASHEQYYRASHEQEKYEQLQSEPEDLSLRNYSKKKKYLSDLLVKS